MNTKNNNEDEDTNLRSLSLISVKLDQGVIKQSNIHSLIPPAMILKNQAT